MVFRVIVIIVLCWLCVCVKVFVLWNAPKQPAMRSFTHSFSIVSTCKEVCYRMNQRVHVRVPNIFVEITFGTDANTFIQNVINDYEYPSIHLISSRNNRTIFNYSAIQLHHFSINIFD